MLREIGNFAVRSGDRAFLSREKAPADHDRGFGIDDRLRVSFDPQANGKVRLSAIKPVAGAPHYRLTPVNMGAAAWYSIEYDLTPREVAGLSELIPCLDAACPQSTSVFALLRLFYAGGESADIGSGQIELRRTRSRRALPICFDDLPEMDRLGIVRATLLLFIEGRDVDVDLFGLQVLGVERVDPRISGRDLKRLRASARQQEVGVRRVTVVPSEMPDPSGQVSGHRPLSEGVFLDIEPVAGSLAEVTSSGTTLMLDFSAAGGSAWRSVEFRFDAVEKTEALTAVVNARGSGSGPGPVAAEIILREYDAAKGDWTDTPCGKAIAIGPDMDGGQAVIDLMPLLTDSRHVHDFGLFLFWPAETGKLAFTELEAIVFDRRAAVPEADVA